MRVTASRALPALRQARDIRSSTSWRRSFSTNHDSNMSANLRLYACEAIRKFLTDARQPVVFEPGEEPLAVEGNCYELRMSAGWLVFQVWNSDRNLLRRVTGVESQKTG